jgi:two-component system chemotaxis response regulator CheY
MATILTVEDSITLRRFTTAILARAGHTVVEARYGNEALEMAHHTAVDLVLSDLHMPGLDGLALVSALRGLERYKAVPILLMTTETDIRKVAAAKAAGASGWLVKPLSADKLLASVAKALA